jgi:hypothetical protein
MRARVRKVKRSEWYKESQDSIPSHNTHAVRYTCTYAIVKYHGERYYVEIDEDDIRNYYGYSRITHDLIGQLNDDLYGEYIDFYEDDNGDYVLDGCLEDYI